MADTAYINDSGLTDVLDVWTGRNAASLLKTGKVKLFKNNITVNDDSVIGDFTESNFGGYAAVTLSGASFGAASVSGGIASAVAAAAFVFTCTGSASQSAYGAYITDSGGTILLACYNFASGPYVLVNNGDSVSTTPTLTSTSLNT